MDFDPRDSDSRDDERVSPRDFYETRHRDDAARAMGRGPGNSRDSDNDDRSDTRDDARWPDRDRDTRERALDVRDSMRRFPAPEPPKRLQNVEQSPAPNVGRARKVSNSSHANVSVNELLRAGGRPKGIRDKVARRE